jgi:hypothetical protein
MEELQPRNDFSRDQARQMRTPCINIGTTKYVWPRASDTNPIGERGIEAALVCRRALTLHRAHPAALSSWADLTSKPLHSLNDMEADNADVVKID